MPNWNGTTNLQVTLDGVDLEESTFVPQVFSQSVASGNLSKTLVLTNNGGSDITNVSIARGADSFNMERANFPSEAYTINASGGTASGVVRTHTWPLLGGPIAGIYYARFVITYTETTVKSITITVIMILQDPGGDPEDVPTYSEFQDRVYDLRLVASGGGPLGFGWGLENDGFDYEDFFEGFEDAIASGVKRIVVHKLHGTHLDGSGHIKLLSRLDLITWANANGREELVTSLVPALDNLEALGLDKLVSYEGAPPTEEEVLATMIGAGKSLEDFQELCFGTLDWGLGRDWVEFVFDDPANLTDEESNPLMAPGEPRFDFMRLVADIKTLQGCTTRIEPRGPSTIEGFDASTCPWNHSLSGFRRFLTPANYARSNPAWYNDGGNVATDTQTGSSPIIYFSNVGGVLMTPYVIASMLYQGNEAAISLSQAGAWIGGGSTFTALWEAVVAVLETVEGEGL